MYHDDEEKELEASGFRISDDGDETDLDAPLDMDPPEMLDPELEEDPDSRFT